MVGGKTPTNYELSFKWDPSGKFVKIGNQFTPRADAQSFWVPKSTVQWPKEGGFDGMWKGMFGQRRYYP
jgi:hypothetical protein